MYFEYLAGRKRIVFLYLVLMVLILLMVLMTARHRQRKGLHRRNPGDLVTTERECDQLLVERVQSGEREAFDFLVIKYRPRLMRVVLHVVHNPVDAEDVVQETFIKAYRALLGFRGDSAFYTWLFRIGINTSKNFLAMQDLCAFAMADSGTVQDKAIASDIECDLNTPESLLACKQIAMM